MSVSLSGPERGGKTHHNVLVVEPGSRHSADKELAAVGVGTSISHREDARPSVFLPEIFVVEFAALRSAEAGVRRDKGQRERT